MVEVVKIEFKINEIRKNDESDQTKFAIGVSISKQIITLSGRRFITGVHYQVFCITLSGSRARITLPSIIITLSVGTIIF